MLNNKRIKVIIVVLLNFMLLMALLHLGNATNAQSITVSSSKRHDSIGFRLSFSSSKITSTYFAEFQKESSSFFADLLDWGVDDIEAEQVFGGYEGATDIGGDYTGDGIIIAILDSGIDKQSGNLHDDFIGKIVEEYDFYNSDSNAEDNYGHGTHCAGIASARDDNDGIIGVAPESELLIGKVGDFVSPYTYFVDDETLADAIDWAVYEGADIISMSWGFFYKLNPVVYEALDDAYDAGVVLVAAAGNEDREIAYPANISQVIAVGAISKDHTLAGYPDPYWLEDFASCTGPELDVVAPGTAIYSTFLNNGFGNYSGTSMAAPHVAGLCALILEAQSVLTPAQVKDILAITATDLGSTGKDNSYGYGEVQAVKAVDAAELYFTDTDSDDLTDAYEKYVYDTDPNDSDSDDDGLNDGYEINTSLTDPNDADTDNDGLDDKEEIQTYATDPHDADTDDDGMPDGWEISKNFDPLSHDSSQDADGDGASNLDEYYYGTDPNDADMDNDGMNDLEEIVYGTNPFVNDANLDPDGDGLTNYEEVTIYFTNPFSSDTDGDGWSDYLEIHGIGPLNPSDPNDPNSVPSTGGGGGFFP